MPSAAWSLWEVGLDRWALVPRGALLAVIGLWLLAPWINRVRRMYPVPPVLVLPTKQGDVYVLDRRSGEPVLPVHGMPAPASTVPGEFAAPVQPFSSLNFTPPALTGKDMWGATPLDQLLCRIALLRMDYNGPYTPPSTRRGRS